MGSDPSIEFGATVRAFAPGVKVFERFRLVRMLGRGGMGVVWLAEDEHLELSVALKFLPEAVGADESAVADLARETRQARGLAHPHIIRVFDFHQDATLAGISMEFIDGATLASVRLKREPSVFEPEELTPWVEQLGGALDYAHRKARVVHRDLKPANLMVGADGEIKVADFGISASVSESVTRVSRVASSSGSPPYMSPQQIMGERPSPSDDIYALGATLYELITGKPPFFSGNIVIQAQSRIPPSMTERRAEFGLERPPLPAAWEETIAACLAKNAADRPASVGEVAARLRQPTPGEPGESVSEAATLVGPVAPAGRPPQSSRAAGVPGGLSAADRETRAANVAKPDAGGRREQARPPARWLLVGTVGVFALVAIFAIWWLATRNGPVPDVGPATSPSPPAGQTASGDFVPPDPESGVGLRSPPAGQAASGDRAEPTKTLPEPESAGIGAPSGVEPALAQPPGPEAVPAGGTPARPPQATGALELNVSDPRVEPEATRVTIDGLVQEAEPGPGNVLRLPRVPAGHHEVVLEHPAFETWSGSAEVIGGRATVIDAKLSPKRAVLALSVGGTPDYRLLLDGQVVAVRDGEASLPADRPVKATVVATGFAAEAREFSLAPGERAAWKVELRAQALPREGQPWTLPEIELAMAWIAPGAFVMGSPPAEAGRSDDEGPQTRVRLTQGFWLGKYEVTQGDWVTVMGANPSKFKAAGLRAPVEQVSWNDAMEFCQKLTDRERAAGRLPNGLAYDLPTEAQWEYACRAGSTGAFSFGSSARHLDQHGNFADVNVGFGWRDASQNDGVGESTAVVGRYRSNAFGLHDMHGNVWEWCRDRDSTRLPGGEVEDPGGPAGGAARVARGGSWSFAASFCRSASRLSKAPGARTPDLGFRVALVRME